jgi:hypothetical protein
MRSNEKHLVGLVGGGGSGAGSGVDVGADKGLAENGDEAALGLLALSSASVDERVDAGWGSRS